MAGIAADLFRLAAWTALAFGALTLARVPGEDSGWLCGVWGCYPPLQALVAMHAFWAVVAAAAADWLLRHAPAPMLTALGKAVAIAGLLCTILLVTRGTIGWLNQLDWPLRYTGHRVIYVLATATDAPFIQLTAAGAVCWWVGRRRIGGRGSVSSTYER